MRRLWRRLARVKGEPSVFEEGTEASLVVETPRLLCDPAHQHNGEQGIVDRAYPGHWVAVRFGNGDKIVYLPEHVRLA